nr:putative ribonuclease H-like domain-containing protein [Tanacetum cinerariifolium]
TIKEEVYVCQPLGFEDPDHLDKVYKVVKVLYGLHQAPRAWYKTLANYLLKNGNRDFNEDFEDYSEDSSYDVSAAGPIVPTAGQNYSNSTNPISAAGPLNSNSSSTHGNSSLRDASKSPDVLEMENIVYSDNENVGAEADFNNLKSSITILNEDFHTCMFACFLSQEESKRVHQAFKDPSWIEAMQEELLQFKMQKVWILVDLPHGKRAIEVYVCQPLGFEDLDHPAKVYKVVKALYGLHQAPRAWLTEGKSASTPIDTEKPLLKDPDGEDVDVHIYRSMIGSLIYLSSSRPDIMFAVCACALFQVTLKVSHLHAVKRIFRYLKGKPNFGLWYPKDSPFDLVAYSDRDYAGASLDRKSTTGGCQFLGSKLISWQCKKQTVIATSSIEAKYVAGASCYAQVLWIQNQMLDYGYNFMLTIIYIDNSSTICIIKNPVLHLKTKLIEIRHHFIRDCNEKKLIQVVKIPTENNFADLLTKAFDVGRFQYLIASIGLLNP